MLRFWKSFSLLGYQVNQDDDDPNLFYLMPKSPTIGQTGKGDGKLAFIFRKYRFADAARAGSKGGGYVMFDVSLEVPQADLDGVRAALLKLYAAATPEKPIDGVKQASAIKLGTVPFTEASVTLNISKDDRTGFVESVKSLGKPSSDGRYTASFSAALSPEGATYFENAMKGSGAGAVQVLYTLKTFFRSGDTVVTASFNKKNTLKYLETRKKSSKLWRESTNEVDISSALLSSGAVKVDATFSNNESEEQKGQIRKWATDAISEAIKRQVPDLVQPQESGADADSVTKKLELSNITDFTQTFNERVAMLLEIHPQGLLPNVGAITNPVTNKPYEWKDYFEEVDLDDPWFKSLNLGVSNVASFEGSPLSRLNVDLVYKADGKEHSTTLSFSKADNARRAWSPFGSTNEYQYKYTAHFQGGPSYTSSFQPSSTKELVVGTEVRGLMEVDAIATGINFDMVQDVAVTVQVIDPAKNTKGPTQTVFLNKETPQARVALLVGNEFADCISYEYSLRYTLPDGVTIRRPAEVASGRQLLVLPCFSDVRTFQLSAKLGAGDKALATLDYVEGNYRRHAALMLDDENRSRNWAVGVIDRTAGALNYSASFDMSDGRTLEISQRKAKADRITLDPKDAVASGGEGVFELTVDPGAMEWDEQGIYNVTLTLNYNGQQHTMSFTGADHTEAKKISWERAEGIKSYSWKAVYICKQNKKTLRVASVTQSSEDIFFLLPSPDEVEREASAA